MAQTLQPVNWDFLERFCQNIVCDITINLLSLRGCMNLQVIEFASNGFWQ